MIRRDAIGLHDRFFEAGGDSIKAIQIVGRLRAAGHALDMRTFFEAPTIAALAAVLDRPAAPEAQTRPAAAEEVTLTPEEAALLFAHD